jgi:hypothetical protein
MMTIFTQVRRRHRRMGYPGIIMCTILLVACAAVMAVCATTTTVPEIEAIDVERFIDTASIRHETTVVLGTSVERWNRMLDDPALMGQLWMAYEFRPEYRVRLAGTAIHVVDPTGLTGLVRVLERSPGHRLYIADGKIKNWFIPVSLSGLGLISMDHEPCDGGMQVRLGFFGEEGGNRATRLLLKVVGPIFNRFIAKRVARNIADLQIVIDDMERDPGSVRARLPKAWRGSFDRLTAPLTGTPLVAPVFPFGHTGNTVPD